MLFWSFSIKNMRKRPVWQDSIQQITLQPLSRVRFEGAESGLWVYCREWMGLIIFGKSLKFPLKYAPPASFAHLSKCVSASRFWCREENCGFFDNLR